MNLLLGVPAVVPLSLAWWLATEYLPMDCRSVADLSDPGLAHCNYTTLDHAPVMMFLLAVTGLLMLWLILAVNVFRPRRLGRPRGAWLGGTLLIPVPFAVLLLLT
ncbi:hypothetical protein HCC30_20305 [Streptomyces sp. HNM0574]|nr:hypothetical protein [Streptomyces sp. HNM0574]